MVLTLLCHINIFLLDVFQGLVLDGTPSAFMLQEGVEFGARSLGIPSIAEHGQYFTM
jgi:hypothetical protein